MNEGPTANSWETYINLLPERHQVRTLLAKTLLTYLLIILHKISDKGIGGTLAGTPPVFSYRRHYCSVFQVFHQRESTKDDCADFYTSSVGAVCGNELILAISFLYQKN